VKIALEVKCVQDLTHTIVHIVEDADNISIAHVGKSHAELNHFRTHGGPIVRIGWHHGIVVYTESPEDLIEESAALSH
jgi:hypothetical protein